MTHSMRISLTSLLAGLALVAAPAALGSDSDPSPVATTFSARGVVTALDAAGISLRSTGDLSVTCGTDGSSPSLAEIAVGQRVAILCRRSGDSPILVGLRRPELKPALLEIEGAVGESDAGQLTVTSRSGRSLTCAVPDSLAALRTGLHPGDLVKALCASRGSPSPTLVRLRRAGGQRPSSGERGQQQGGRAGLTDIVGTVTAVGESITVANDSRSLTCRTTPSTATAAAALTIGAPAGILCQEGNLVAVRTKGDDPTPPSQGPGENRPSPTETKPASTETKPGPTETKSAPAPAGSSENGSGSPTASVTVGARGTIASLSPDRIFVTTDGGTRSCFVPETLRAAVAAYAVGSPVRIMCSGPDITHVQLVGIENG